MANRKTGGTDYEGCCAAGKYQCATQAGDGLAEGAFGTEELATMSWLMSTLTRCPGMMTCREMENFLADYCDDKLNWRQSAVFRLHLMMCGACRAYVEAYQRARALAKATLPLRDEQGAEIEVPAELIEAIMRAHKCGDQSSGAP